jgi:hypothetical protein
VSFVGCACCWTNGDITPEPPTEGFGRGAVRITSPGGTRPLSELTADELREVAELMPFLGGDADVLRHYLPRLLEIAITTGFDWPDFEPLIHHLAMRDSSGHGQVQTWPISERDALERFFLATWTARLQQDPDIDWELSADAIVCGTSAVVDDITPFLEHWLTFTEPFAAQHLAEFLDDNTELSLGQLDDGFWDGAKEYLATNTRKVVQWANAVGTKAAVQSALDHSLSGGEVAALRTCLGLLSGNEATFCSPRSNQELQPIRFVGGTTSMSDLERPFFPLPPQDRLAPPKQPS